MLIVQHMPELFTRLLAERLNEPLRSRGQRGSSRRASPSWPYLRRQGKLGTWKSSARRLAVLRRQSSSSPRIQLKTTAAPQWTFCSARAVPVYGARILAVVLTGMGYDGLAGGRLIRQHHGTILAQDEATSAVWGMPGAVTNAGLAQRVLPIQAIAPEILRLTGPEPARSQSASRIDGLIPCLLSPLFRLPIPSPPNSRPQAPALTTRTCARSSTSSRRMFLIPHVTISSTTRLAKAFAQPRSHSP